MSRRPPRGPAAFCLRVFAAPCVGFFLAEMGDKTQIATVALAARYTAIVPVVIRTTLGMLIANVPVIFDWRS